MGVAKFLGDKLVDLVTGLGGGRDRTTTMSFANTLVPISLAEIETMYRTDWVARKLVDIVPQDMVREGRRWKADKESITAIEKYEQQLEVSLWPKLKEALTRARLLGGSAIFIGIEGQPASSPLDPSKVQADDLAYLTVLTRYQLTFPELDYDPQSATFGQPKMWTMTTPYGTSVEVHPSRLVIFKGPEILTQPNTNTNTVWGDPILQVVYNVVRDAASVQQHIAGLVPDLRNDVIYVPRLGDILKNPIETEKLTKRFAYAKTMKSAYNMLLLEGNGGQGGNENGEKWEVRQLSFSNLPELMQKFLEIAAAAADIPITRFLGQSPGGENSTGEADMRNYYDHIKSLQKLQLAPRLQVLDEIILRSAGVYDDAIHYEWAPLWALSETEKAEIMDKKASAARTIAGNGNDVPLMNLHALSDALVNGMVEDGSLPGLEEAVDKHGTLADTIPELPDPVKQAEQQAEQQQAQLEMRQQAQKQLPAPGKAASQQKPTTDAAPRSLYVRRKLNNAKDLIDWAKKAGFKKTLRPSDMHVTVLFSKTPVDWMKMGSDWAPRRILVNPGGPRVVERLGPTATVLSFYSTELVWRHEDMVRNGASEEHDEYICHVTITHEPHDVDLEKIKPYQGVLRFGYEIFEEINEDWRSNVKEV